MIRLLLLMECVIFSGGVGSEAPDEMLPVKHQREVTDAQDSQQRKGLAFHLLLASL